METPFDKQIANHIRKKLLAHSEPYDIGAWEQFLAGKQKKRRAIIFWYGKIAAGFLLLFSLLFLWKNGRTVPSKVNKTEIQRESPVVDKNDGQLKPSESYESIKKKDSAKEGLRETTVQANSTTQTGIKQQSPTGSVPIFTEDKKRQETTLVIDHKKKKDSSLGKRNIVLALKDVPKKPNERVIAGNAKMDKDKMDDSIPTDTMASKAIILALESEVMELPKEHGTNRFTFGLVLASGYNELSGATATGNGLSTRIGFITDVTLFDDLSISSGVTLARQGITRDRDLPVLAMGGISQTQSQTVQLWSMDVPLDLKYTFPASKRNMFISAGISSLVTFNQRTDTENSLTREVITILEVDGVPTTETTTETVTASTSDSFGGTQFYPAGILNFSAGFSQPLSDKLRLEIAPFFKYPVQDLTTEDLRFREMGLNLKMYFQAGNKEVSKVNGQ